MREARPRRAPWILAVGVGVLLAGCASDEPPRHDWLLGSRLPSTDTLVADALPTRTQATAAAIDAATATAMDSGTGAGTRSGTASGAGADPSASNTSTPAGAPGASQTSSPSPVASLASPTLAFWPRLQSSQAIAALPEPLWSGAWSEYAARPDFVSRALQRAAPYLQHVGEVLDQQGLPPELALLPVIESGYEPRAVSPATATGVWQFMPETARRYGLRIDWLRDERRDPLAATNAAARLLSDLWRRFGDWHLALAAYNCGELCVARAQERARAGNRGTDFASIQPWLPDETQAYVPRFVAVQRLVRDAARTGVSLPPLERQPRLLRVRLDRPADLASLARLAGTSVDELSLLNAGVMRQVVTREAPVWLTEAQTQRLQLALRQPDARLAQFKPVAARPRESLQQFALRHGTDVARLRQLNSIPAALSVIESGTLFVPAEPDERVELAALESLPPLRMRGEEELQAQRQSLAARDQALLAAHPEWVDSGWTPGRLQLPGRRR